MKKYFETPAVNAAMLDADDMIMASAGPLAKQNGNLKPVTDYSKAANELWQGANEGWL